MDAEHYVHDFADRLRKMLSEAEERAAEIVRDAEVDAKRIREQAESESKQRIAAAREAFAELQSKLGLTDEVEPGPVTVPEPEPPPVPEPAPPPVPEPTPPEPPPETAPAVVPEPTPPPDEATPPSAADGAAKSEDDAGARLVALNMALDGASREDIQAKLAEDFALADSSTLVDEVLTVARS
jgi:outer membrane biosynthesis protein TonB